MCQHHREKSLAKRFSKHDTLQKLVNCWYVCPSFSASDVSMAKSLQGLTGESRKCDGDLDVAHVTGWKVGGQLETERGERERVAAELRLLRWPDGGQTGLSTAFKVSSPGTQASRRAQDCLCITRKLFMSSLITHNQAVRPDAIKVKFCRKRK